MGQAMVDHINENWHKNQEALRPQISFIDFVWVLEIKAVKKLLNGVTMLTSGMYLDVISRPHGSCVTLGEPVPVPLYLLHRGRETPMRGKWTHGKITVDRFRHFSNFGHSLEIKFKI